MARIEIISGPDSKGRYLYVRYLTDINPACCLTCGACASRGCACYGAKTERAQVFFSALPAGKSPSKT